MLIGYVASRLGYLAIVYVCCFPKPAMRCVQACVVPPVGSVSSCLCIQVEAKRQAKLRANMVSSQLRSCRLSGLAEQFAVNLLSTHQLRAMCVLFKPGTTEG